MTPCECFEKRLDYAEKLADKPETDSKTDDFCKKKIDFVKKYPSCIQSHLDNTVGRVNLEGHIQENCPELLTRQEEFYREKVGESLPDY